VVTPIPDAQLTHVGLYVDDMEKMVSFYTGLLGLVVTDHGGFLGRELTFLSRRADEHHQLVLVTGRTAVRDTVLLSQVSFRVDGLDAVKYFHRRALELGATAMEGRNHGNSWSIYFEDPEGNRIEIYTPTPWYVRQPCRVPLDVTASNEAIEAATIALIEESATWRPVETWQAELAGRIASVGGGGERST
jgi:catechol 2,3-dioxygenase-like lactoylglutathione lyase family enzyme